MLIEQLCCFKYWGQHIYILKTSLILSDPLITPTPWRMWNGRPLGVVPNRRIHSRLVLCVHFCCLVISFVTTVTCAEGERLGWSYSISNRERPVKSTITFRGVTSDTMPISGEESSEFFKMTSEFETKYGSVLHKASGGCLHLEFLHETEEDAKRMCEDKDFVQKRFVQFMTNVGKDASSCTIEATYRRITSKPKQAEHIPQGNKDPYGPRSVDPSLTRALYFL